MARLFIAVKIKPPRQLAGVLTRLRRLGKPVKVVPDENLHITLRFLGPTDEKFIGPIVEAIRISVQDTQAFDLYLAGMGAYPNLHRPSVVWVGAENAATLSNIVEGLAKPLADLGFAPEDRPWEPHVTLCRIKAKPPKELIDLINAARAVSFGTVRIRSVDLLSSDLLPTGPVYSTVDRVRLG